MTVLYLIWICCVNVLKRQTTCRNVRHVILTASQLVFAHENGDM